MLAKLGASGAPSPTLPTKGEGVRRCIWQEGATNSISTSLLVGEVGSGVAKC